ncbi:hypothetical protein TNCT_189661 [Trichonephila clavata]|uniref:Uncharacterized protein n=1 Tax=Trichonephila clavata TaxID=2740835 RepID=A0A8X6L8B9_TRICU|nr:hypothetical protein TNCT_189661 [Trichonephila clavata]
MTSGVWSPFSLVVCGNVATVCGLFCCLLQNVNTFNLFFYLVCLNCAVIFIIDRLVKEMDAGHMFKGRGSKYKKCRARRIQKVNLDYSQKNKLLEEMRLMMEKDISVKEKILTQRELLIERHCRAETIYVISRGEKISIFLDTPTKIERLSHKKYFKLSLKMKQNLMRVAKQKVDERKLKRILKSFEENEKKVSLLPNTVLRYWVSLLDLLQIWNETH